MSLGTLLRYKKLDLDKQGISSKRNSLEHIKVFKKGILFSQQVLAKETYLIPLKVDSNIRNWDFGNISHRLKKIKGRKKNK